jgi:Holliday junction resolvase RusA-like endonuclease
MNCQDAATVQMKLQSIQGGRSITFHVPGRPISKLRSRGGQGRGGKVRTPKTLTTYKIRVAEQAQNSIDAVKQALMEYGIDMTHDELLFPKGDKLKMSFLFVYANHKWEGDVDNLQGSIMDALNGVNVKAKADCDVGYTRRLKGEVFTMGQLWHDDKQVVTSHVHKLFLSEPEGRMMAEQYGYEEGVYVDIEAVEFAPSWAQTVVFKTLAFRQVYL